MNSNVHADLDQDDMIDGYFIGSLISNTINPGIRCITDIINNYTTDYTCESYYMKNGTSFSKLAIKIVAYNFIYALLTSSGCSIVIALSASKLSAEAVESIINDKFEINIQSYAANTFQHVAKMIAVSTLCIYFDIQDKVTYGMLVNTAPALLDLGGSIIYQAKDFVNQQINAVYENINMIDEVMREDIVIDL